jgi:hypothetical protein
VGEWRQGAEGQQGEQVVTHAPYTPGRGREVPFVR